MGGFFGVVSRTECVEDIYYGTDYHSHLGTRRGGMAMSCGNGSIRRRIHDISNTPFRTKFGAESLALFKGCEIGGTEGTICQQNQQVSWSCAETDHQWVSVSALPAKLPSPIVQWAMANTPEEIPEIFGLDAALRLTQVMEMAYAGK